VRKCFTRIATGIRDRVWAKEAAGLFAFDRIGAWTAFILIFCLAVIYLWEAAQATLFTPFTSVEETAYTLISARNFLEFGFLNSGFLQDFSVGRDPADHPYVYNHMPPGPDIFAALLLQWFGGSLFAARVVWMVVAVAGFYCFYLFSRKFLACYGLAGGGWVIVFLGAWIIIQMMDRQIYSPFPVFAFLPPLLFMKSREGSSPFLYILSIAIIFISAIYLEYSLLSGIIAMWGFFWFTGVIKLKFRDIVLIVGTFAAGIFAHLIQNLLFFGPELFFQELKLTLSNRIFGYPLQTTLEHFYQEHGIVHHGSKPLNLGVWLAQIWGQFEFHGNGYVAVAVLLVLIWPLHTGIRRDSPFTARWRLDTEIMRQRFHLVCKFAFWISGTVITPILLFPAFAQEVNLRGQGANYFFTGIGVIAILALLIHEVERSLRAIYREILVRPLRVQLRVMRPVMRQYSYLGGMRCSPLELWNSGNRQILVMIRPVILLVLIVASTWVLTQFAYAQARVQIQQLWHIANLAISENMYGEMDDLSRFDDGLFLTNVNVTTVGVITRHAGFGVCGPEAVGRDGKVDLSKCKAVFMRRADFWRAQQPKYYFYFWSPTLFPGFADCLPTGTLPLEARGGTSCMEDQLARLQANYTKVYENGLFKVFDLTHPNVTSAE